MRTDDFAQRGALVLCFLSRKALMIGHYLDRGHGNHLGWEK